LHGVEHHAGVVLARDVEQRAQWRDRAGLVLHPGQTHERRLRELREHRVERARRRPAPRVRRDRSYRGGRALGRALDRGAQRGVRARVHEKRHGGRARRDRVNGEVKGLGSAAREDQLARRGAARARDGGARGLDPPAGEPPCAMDARRVRVQVIERGAEHGADGRGERRRRVMIEVDHGLGLRAVSTGGLGARANCSRTSSPPKC
jgi:hypothetical protein